MTHDPNRREALRLCALAALALTTRTALSSALAPGPADEEALDAALARLQREEPLARQGLSTHAPMAVEALCAMGQGARIEPWLESYRRPAVELPPSTTPIDGARWREALALHAGAASWEQQNARYGDWVVYFERQLAEQSWPAVVDLWVQRLAPGLASAATHGVIRTAHAVRALARRPSTVRLRELARGLAYWASSYQELDAGRSAVSTLEPARAQTDGSDLGFVLESLPLYADRHGGPPRGNFVAGLTAAAREPGLLPAIDRARLPATAAAWAAFADLGARALLRHGLRHDPLAFVHAITGPLALRRLAPHLQPATLAAALPHAWRTAALLYAAYARRDDPLPPAAAAPVALPALAELAQRAAEHGDEHLIKLTDAALEQHAATPTPGLITAAAALGSVL